MKVIVVGRENVGKTALIKRITNTWEKKDDKEREVTDGIEMHRWKVKGHKADFRLWDFAGQEVYYITHQLFLSENSINIVVFNVMESLDDEQDYILVEINSIKIIEFNCFTCWHSLG